MLESLGRNSLAPYSSSYVTSFHRKHLDTNKAQRRVEMRELHALLRICTSLATTENCRDFFSHEGLLILLKADYTVALAP